MRKKRESDDYDVGYGRPPKHTRFKPGQSGNPKGRPTGSKDFRSLLHRTLFKKMRVTEDGEIRSMSRVEAVVTRLVAKGLNGDVRAAESVLRLMQQHFPAGEEPEIMKVYLQRFTDGEILAERNVAIGGGQSTDWHYFPPKSGAGDAERKDKGADAEAITSDQQGSTNGTVSGEEN